MTRAQALILSILAGLVLLICIGLAMLLLLPANRLRPASQPPQPVPPAAVPTATLPKFLPTGSVYTPVREPSPTNTRVPTATPRPQRTPTPTVVLDITYPVKPTATPTPVVIVPAPTATPVLATATVPGPRGYSISFEADETTLAEDDCTTLRWRVEGAESVVLDNETVEPSGKKKVCPKLETTYQLTVSLPDSAQLIIKKIEISIEEDDEDE